MEESIPLFGGKSDTNKISDGCPSHFMMSLFPIPRSVEKKINQLRRTFLWRDKEKKRYNLAKWNVVIINVRQGGLGITNLSIQSIQNTKSECNCGSCGHV